MRGWLATGIGVAAAALFVGAWALAERGAAPLPPHRVLHPRETPSIRGMLQQVSRLRATRAGADLPVGGVGNASYQEGLQKVREAAPGGLHYLDEIVLNTLEPVPLRVELLNVIAAHRGEETRVLLLALFDSPGDVGAVRLAALEHLMTYRDAATFECIRGAWRSREPFEGRYHLCRALAESGREEAVPLLIEALGPAQPLDVRCHAALGLGRFAGRPEVREELGRRAISDPAAPVRENARRALGAEPHDGK